MPPLDLEDYIWQQRTIHELPAAAEPLREELVRQVERMVAAGHLQPLFRETGRVECTMVLHESR